MNRKSVIVIAISCLAALGALWLVFAPDSSSASARTQGTEGAVSRQRAKPFSARAPALAPLDIAQATPVCGRIIDEHGAAIAGAHVGVFRQSLANTGGVRMTGRKRAGFTGRTTASGDFRIESVTAGPLSVSATAPGYVSREMTLAQRGCDEGAATIVLHSGGVRISGVVADATGGAVDGALIRAKPLGGQRAYAFKRSPFLSVADAEGHYELWVTPGLYSLRASADGYADAPTTARIAELPHEQDFTLFPGAVVEGVVVAAGTDTVVPSAQVFVGTPDAGRYGRVHGADSRAVSDGAGRFRLEGLPPGPLQLFATAPGGVSDAPVSLTVSIGEYRSDVELSLVAAHAVAGVVVTEGDDDDPVGEAMVTLTSDAGVWVADAPTSPEGQFVVESVPNGTYQVNILAPGRPSVLLGQSVQVADADVDDAVLRMLAGATASGRVIGGGTQTTVRVEVDANALQLAEMGGGIANSTVVTRCDADGNFELSGLAPGPIVLVAEDPERGRAEETLRVGLTDEDRIELELRRAAVLSGQVVDEDGTAVAGARMSIVQQGVPSTTMRSQPTRMLDMAGVFTDESGHFEDGSLAPGSYSVAVMGAQGPLSLSNGQIAVAVELDDTSQNVSMVVARNDALVEGQVVDEDGEALPFAIVRAKAAGASRFGPPTQVEDDGTFVLSGLPPRGTVVVAATRTDRGGAAVFERCSEGEMVTLAFPASGGLTVDTSGQGPGTVRISGGATLTRTFSAQRDAVSFDGLSTGEYVVSVETEQGFGAADVALAAGDDALTRVALQPWGEVSGTALMSDGRPAVDWVVMVEGPQGLDHSRSYADLLGGGGVKTDEDGAFEVGGLAPGRNRLFVLPRDPAAGEVIVHTFELEQDATLALGPVVAKTR